MGDDFVSEDDPTFEGFLKRQGVPATSTPDELKVWRSLFDKEAELRENSQPVGLMSLRPRAGKQRYAVVIEDQNDLWLTLWVQCSSKGEIFILYPRGNPDWDAHTSYHLNGVLHHKIYDLKTISQNRQPLTADFKGCEHLGTYRGHGKSSGAVCDPKMFDGIVIVEPGILEQICGSVAVDLVQPGYEPRYDPNAVERRVFPRGDRPSVVIYRMPSKRGSAPNLAGRFHQSRITRSRTDQRSPAAPPRAGEA